jgi:hypothetical protein
MALIDEIQEKIAADRFEFSKHAVDQSIIRRIGVHKVQEIFRNAEVIEDYPEDKYGASCLVFGRTLIGRPLHIQCSYPARPLIKIITLYEPDPAHRIDFKIRRST